MDARHYVRIALLGSRRHLASLLYSLCLHVLLVADYSTQRRPVNVVLGAALLSWLSNVLSFIQIVCQVVNLPLVHRDLRNVFTRLPRCNRWISCIIRCCLRAQIQRVVHEVLRIGVQADILLVLFRSNVHLDSYLITRLAAAQSVKLLCLIAT